MALIVGGVVVAVILVVVGVVALSGDDDDEGDRDVATGPLAPGEQDDEPDRAPQNGPGSDDPDDYGDDPDLDALWDDCEAGDYEACDQLYFDSPRGSAYEDFGDSCGERNEPGGLCTTIYPDEGAGDS